MSAPPIARPVIAEQLACQICARPINANKPKRLFGCVVCKKCRNRFISRRQLAYVVDSTAYAVLTYVVMTIAVWFLGVLFVPGAGPQTSIEVTVFILSWLVLPFLFSFKDGFSGVSLGKWLFDLQVVDRESREPIGFWQSLKRNVWLMIPIVPLVIALQLSHGPRPGDGYANTAVIWRKYRNLPPFNPRGFVCLACGYDLTGNVTGRCPECGREFSFPSASPAFPMSAQTDC